MEKACHRETMAQNRSPTKAAIKKTVEPTVLTPEPTL
jgi:hypothetical protein